jgi:rhodanese-related sulfurtransferase
MRVPGRAEANGCLGRGAKHGVSAVDSVPVKRRARATALALTAVVWVTSSACSPGDEDAGGGVRIASQREVLEIGRNGNGPLILDVRSEGEYRSGHVPGAVNVPHTQLRERLAEMEPYRERGVVLYCEVGGRAEAATRLLEGAGFEKLSQLVGHMSAWRANGLPIER